jgi:tetratricopeptide (TPR) repeat protein
MARFIPGREDSVIRETDARFLGLIQKGSLNEAADYLSRFLALHEREAVLSFKLANLLNELGRYEESSDLALKVIELEHDHKAAWDLRGDILFRIGDFSHSIQAYQEVVRIAPDDAMGHYNLGCAQDAAGDPKQAEVNWKRVLELENPRMKEAGIKESAEGTLRYSVDVFARPPSFHAHLALGRLYVREGSTAQYPDSGSDPARPGRPRCISISARLTGDPDKKQPPAQKNLALGGEDRKPERPQAASARIDHRSGMIEAATATAFLMKS